jgi:hypothetical protein
MKFKILLALIFVNLMQAQNFISENGSHRFPYFGKANACTGSSSNL